jgi:hypothetical protein
MDIDRICAKSFHQLDILSNDQKKTDNTVLTFSIWEMTEEKTAL